MVKLEQQLIKILLREKFEIKKATEVVTDVTEVCVKTGTFPCGQYTEADLECETVLSFLHGPQGGSTRQVKWFTRPGVQFIND